MLDLVELVLPQVQDSSSLNLRPALDRYEDKAVARTRPAVLASRQACLDAHQWSRISPASPLLSRRSINVKFNEEDGSVEILD